MDLSTSRFGELEERYLDNFRIFDQESNMKEIHTTEQDVCEFCSEVFDAPAMLMWHFLDAKDKILFDENTISSLSSSLLSSAAAAVRQAESAALTTAQQPLTELASPETDAMMEIAEDPPAPPPATPQQQQIKEETVEYIVVDTTEKPPDDDEEVEILEEYTECSSVMEVESEVETTTTEDSSPAASVAPPPENTIYYFKCSYCDNIYSNKKELNAHQINEHVHKCQICGANFKDDDALQEHAKRHTDTKLFMCGVCKVILEKRYLGQHMKKHLQQQAAETHTCKICRDTFSRKMLLSVHISQKHSIFTKDYVCQICKLPYDENNNDLHSGCHWWVTVLYVILGQGTLQKAATHLLSRPINLLD